MGLSQAFIFWLMLNSKDYWKKIIIFWTSKKLEQNGHKNIFCSISKLIWGWPLGDEFCFW